MNRTSLLVSIGWMMLLMPACNAFKPGTAASLPVSATGASALPSLPSVRPSSSARQLPAAGVGGTPVAITLAANKITSSLTTFKVGVTYTFLVTNAGPGEACFDIAPPESATGGLGASTTQALVAVSRNDLPAGRAATVKYAFPDAAVGTRLEFSCLMRRHYDDGMRLTITVTK